MSVEWRRLWAQGEEVPKEDWLQLRRCANLERRNRLAFPGNVRVTHPARGEIVVPGASPFAAILCAAEAWGCDWMEIREARVEAEDTKKDLPGQGQAEEEHS